MSTLPERLIDALDRRLAQRSGWLILACLMALAALPALFLDRFQGDEFGYTIIARTIADYARGDADRSELVRVLVGNGHFMPGPALLSSPLFMVFSDPAVWLTRLWRGAVMVLLWLWSIAETRRNLGPAFALAAVIFPAATISWHMMAATANGDAAAGLLLLIALGRTYGLCRALVAGQDLPLRAILALEIVLAAMIYMRGPTILAAAIMHVALLIAAGMGRAHRARAAFAVLCGLALLGTSLAPWMLATRRVLGEPVLTTASLPLSLAYTFGDRDKLCFGPCPDGNIWFVMPEFSRQEARRLGMNQLQVQRRMADHALEGLTAQHFFATVRGNFIRFAARPTEASERLISGSFAVPQHLKPTFEKALRAIDWPIYALFLLLLPAANLVVLRKSLEQQVISLAVKLMTLVIFIQPFTHPSHGRYWPVFAPLMALSAGLFLTILARRTSCAAPGIGFLSFVQGVHVAAVLTIAALVIVA